jgi:hypothetical protein
MFSKSIETLREELAKKVTAHVAAKQAAAAAWEAFCRDETSATQKAHTEGEKAEESALKSLKAAQYRLEEAETKAKADHRAALEKEAQELEADLSRPDPEEEGRVTAEVAAYAAAAKVRVSRREANVKRVAKAQRLQNLRGELGLESRTLLVHQTDVEPPHFPVSERLQELAAGPTSDPFAHYLAAIARVQF